ncbi:MAG: site-2 protease family protein, partial [Thermoleophilia bacterium]|nr:site-2 protease family protein [Thermoleophilia bacterium]
ETNPGLGSGTRAAMGVIAAALFLASILLHEIGHAVQARRDGMTIDGITLWMFGGVARFVGMFPSAGAEFRIAIAGPLVSLGLGLGFTGVALVPGIPEPVDAVAAWLGYINIALLVFNMLPALPTDGGRVLRSAIWWRTGDLVRATRIAGATGRFFAGAIIGLGILIAFGMGSPLSGIWMALIGWFLLQASARETQAAAVTSRLSGLTVGDVMVPDPVTTTAGTTLDELDAVTRWTGAYTTYPVLDDGRVVGLFPIGVLHGVPRDAWETTPVSRAMVPVDNVARFRPEEPLGDAVGRLQGFGLHRGLVLDDGGRLAGLLSMSDVARLVQGGRLRNRAPGPDPA